MTVKVYKSNDKGVITPKLPKAHKYASLPKRELQGIQSHTKKIQGIHQELKNEIPGFGKKH